MCRACRYLIGAITLILVATPAFSQQATIESDRKLIEVVRLIDTKVGRFLGYGSDFGEYYLRAVPSQKLPLSGLMHEASRAATSLQATQYMLLLYNYTIFHPARADARIMVQSWLDSTTEGLGTSVGTVNDLLSGTGGAAIVDLASRLKDDLRETIYVLKAINLP